MPDKHAEATEEALWSINSRWLYRHGLLLEIVSISDQSKEFCNALVIKLLSLLKVKKTTLAYHPQTNA
jgi:hypothetical protein